MYYEIDDFCDVQEVEGWEDQSNREMVVSFVLAVLVVIAIATLIYLV